MTRIVVVATSPVDREELADHVDPTDELVVVVPAVEQSRLDWLANDEDAARGTRAPWVRRSRRKHLPLRRRSR